jgi:hypothetical protein
MCYNLDLLKILTKYNIKDIVITEHALKQALFRNIKIDEIKENIINPKRLKYYNKQKANNDYEEKYDCYFIYSRTLCHRYILVLNEKCIICTVIKINRKWQRMVEKYGKI